MKKLIALIITVALCFGACISLSACSEKLPTTEYEKVEFAFKGVEKSFKNISKKSSHYVDADGNTVLFSGNDTPELFAAHYGVSDTANAALQIISNLYTSDDSRGDDVSDIEYNQPPMVQFQYLKAVLEKIGKDYEFGKKYYNTMTGSIYMDMATGKEKPATEADYKYDYTFILALQIDIDENDLITADVSFDMTFTKGAESHNTKWYVGFNLDYDMTSTTPSYKLNMMTDEDETGLPYRNTFLIENDYVEVDNNKIKEWRKFVFETDRRLIKDDTHQTFDDYIAEGIVYNVNTVKWYKNSNLNKITQMSDEKAVTIAKAYYDYGLTSTDINGTPFINKEGVESVAIAQFYREMSNMYKDDVIKSMVIDYDEDDHGDDHGDGGQGGQGGDQGDQGEDQQPRDSLAFLDITGESYWENQLISKDGNPTLSELLNESEWWTNDGITINHPTAWLKDGATGRETVSLDKLSFKVSIGNNSVPINLNDRVAEKLASLGQAAAYNATSFTIMATYTERGLTTSFDSQLGELIYAVYRNFPNVFPTVFTNLGVPTYATEGDGYAIVKLDDAPRYCLTILTTTEGERDAFITALTESGFELEYENCYIKHNISGRDVRVEWDMFNTQNFEVIIEVTDAHEHTYSDAWTTSETEHWHAATCGHDDQKSGLGAHVYDDDYDFECNVCGYVREPFWHPEVG